MTLHPLLALAQDRDVRHSSGFRRAAADLSGEVLAAHFADERRDAPRRSDSGKRFLQPHGGRPPAERQRSKDEEHLAAALVRSCRDAGKPLTLPDEGGSVEFVDWGVPLKAAAADAALGDADPNRGVERVDLVGVTPEGRLVLGFIKYLEPNAARAGTGDTPLRFLLDSLAHAAIVEANRAAIGAELQTAHARTFSEVPAVVLLLASPRYWALCRRREAQKGAAWVHELERLAREIEQHIGVSVYFLGMGLEGDPGWIYDEQGARLPSVRIDRAWEPGAGRVRPKPKPRPKAAEPVETVVEAALERPVRSYGPHESYHPGDRIEHPTLGLGVVQKCFPGKVEVRFGEATSRLVAGRPL
ncbi:MAG TPA: hypothetical protein VNE71_10190 [Myxococcota bacterium]|nr:hypothetical protein [Myxococcota bacterium]